MLCYYYVHVQFETELFWSPTGHKNVAILMGQGQTS